MRTVTLKGGPLDGQSREIEGRAVVVPVIDQQVREWVYRETNGWVGEARPYDEAPKPNPR